MNPFSSGAISSASVWRINCAGLYLVDVVIFDFLELAERGCTGEGESVVGTDAE